MVVSKILNNNIISAVDEQNREIILVGRGLGWGAKAGKEIDRSKIEKIFRMDTEDSTNRLKQLLLEVPVEAVEAATQIVDYARNTLNKRLNKNVYITLTDHINFAVERNKKGMVFSSPLNWEIQKLYRREYEIGKHALSIIRDCLGEELPIEEASSIALHIVNSEFDCEMEKTIEITNLIRDSLNLVRYSFKIDLKESSLNYQRFITHLRFYAQRVIEGKMLNNGKDFLYDLMKQHYPKQFQCAQKICVLTQKQYQTEILDEEVTFLCAHIVRLTEREEQQAEL